MSDLFKLKRWLTLIDSAAYLSSILGETVKDYDILQLALDGHIKLSLQLVNIVYARPVIKVNFVDVEFVDVPSPDGGTIRIEKNGRLIRDEHGTWQIRNHLIELSNDIWELVLDGAGRVDIEHMYQMKTNGPEVNYSNTEGVMVKNKLGDMFLLMTPFSANPYYKDTITDKFEDRFYPSSALPDTAILVLTTTAINDLVGLVSNSKLESKPIYNKERETLLVIIGALAKELGLDIKKISKTGDLIANMTQLIGSPIGATTIETHLKKIQKALENRAK